MTPLGSTASILIGNKGVTSAEPGSIAGLLLAVDDTRPGSRSASSWSSQPLPSGSLNDAYEA